MIGKTVWVCAANSNPKNTPLFARKQKLRWHLQSARTDLFVSNTHTHSYRFTQSMAYYRYFWLLFVSLGACKSVPRFNTFHQHHHSRLALVNTTTHKNTNVCCSNRVCVPQESVLLCAAGECVICVGEYVCGYRQCNLFYWIDLAAAIGFSFGHFLVKNIWLVDFWVQINTGCGELF